MGKCCVFFDCFFETKQKLPAESVGKNAETPYEGEKIFFELHEPTMKLRFDEQKWKDFDRAVNDDHN